MKLRIGSAILVATFAATSTSAQVVGDKAVLGQSSQISAPLGFDPKSMKNEGNFSVGLWYSQADSVSLSIGVDQEKFLGTDEEFHFGIEASAYAQTVDLSVTDPDFFESAYVRRFAVSFYKIHPNLTQNGSYTFSGGETSVGFGRQITDETAISFGAGSGKILMTDDPSLPDFISSYVDENGAENTSVFGYFNVSYDHTNDRANPTQGLRLNFSNEIGAVAGSSYLKTEASVSHFSRLFGSADLNLHGSFARGQILNGGNFPIFENYYAGGPSSLRGFAQNTLGPTSAIPNSTDRAYTGGRLRVMGGIEISTSVARREDMHVLTFVDIGNVFGDVADLTAAEMRGSFGIGMRWDSPVGPLSINLAQPMNTQLGDQLEQVQFTLGASF